MMHYTLLCLLPALAAGMLTADNPGGRAQPAPDSLTVLIPETGILRGWSQTGSARIFRGAELFRFIDGGADLFFEYGFREAAGVGYVNSWDEQIQLEVYRMADAGAAYGIYSVRSGGTESVIGFGAGGIIDPYYIMFWQGPYYISIAASDTTMRCREGIEMLARAIGRNITATGEKPHIMKLLPGDSLLKQMYVRGRLGLSLKMIFDAMEIFPMDEAAVGIYKQDTVAIIRYDSVSTSRRRMSSIVQALSSDTLFKRISSDEELFGVKDNAGCSIYAGRTGSYVVFAISSAEATAFTVCKTMLKRLKE